MSGDPVDPVEVLCLAMGSFAVLVVVLAVVGLVALVTA